MQMEQNIRRTVFAFILVILFFSGSLISTPVGSTAAVDQEIKLRKRELDIDPTEKKPGGIGDQTVGSLHHDSSICEMALFERTGLDFNNNGRNWEGRPLGPKNSQYDKQCISMDDLYSPLTRAINSYIVTGWCDCSFYNDTTCEDSNFLFNAYNRQDGDLYTSATTATDLMVNRMSRYESIRRRSNLRI
ncbi:hypothetical protein AA313_de0206595 [Arthrobotrys entomopaga]|nr:hypothetical protein AA313_de0206595 [Arthrobotrys entomopaga]